MEILRAPIITEEYIAHVEKTSLDHVESVNEHCDGLQSNSIVIFKDPLTNYNFVSKVYTEPYGKKFESYVETISVINPAPDLKYLRLIYRRHKIHNLILDKPIFNSLGQAHKAEKLDETGIRHQFLTPRRKPLIVFASPLLPDNQHAARNAALN